MKVGLCCDSSAERLEDCAMVGSLDLRERATRIDVYSNHTERWQFIGGRVPCSLVASKHACVAFSVDEEESERRGGDACKRSALSAPSRSSNCKRGCEHGVNRIQQLETLCYPGALAHGYLEWADSCTGEGCGKTSRRQRIAKGFALGTL